ncbi:hypothetical protein [Rhodococcus spongiicola]|uniref:Uncharacterized protein n=1 Tax=Rhodococcus spongiicola TaxID=2487352 RepID=A0A3S3A276_9NOCA|nr:hypothetical protein [Rhodococcus spongiicola]RVW00430.1 hypothetical protein EF834_17435 [Rhodococcus spongiicola]
MGFIRKAMVVVAVTSGLVAGGSGIAQANTRAVDPSLPAWSTGSWIPAGSLIDIITDPDAGPLEYAAFSVVFPFAFTAHMVVCLSVPNENLSVRGVLGCD